MEFYMKDCYQEGQTVLFMNYMEVVTPRSIASLPASAVVTEVTQGLHH